jgi:sirohydrochlorin ferrochelatase
MDVLTRRVSHRLGCPVAAGQVQHGVLHLDAPLRNLHAKGAREIVAMPLRFAPAPMVMDSSIGRRDEAPYATGVAIREAQPLGGHQDVIDAAVEVLSNSERTPSRDTRVVMLVPHSEEPVVRQLAPFVDSIGAAGWRDGVVLPLPPNDADCGLNGALAVAPHEKVLLMPLAVAPGPFSARVAACAEQLGLDYASVSLHSAEALTKLICRRVNEARRA